ncbi:MAG: amidase [Alphaproteobacteria bacterium]|nr:amidase [Alphaproteobacteria bacterium]MBL7099829.1 amidase [Alphaproteobacteria bacterium]
MAFKEYASYDGLGLAALVAKKKIKPSELMDEAIARTEALNPKLNAVVFKDYDRARKTAAGKLGKGPFAGVPFLLKDIFGNCEGMPTRNASAFIPSVPMPHDDILVQKFKAAGLIPFGKTNAPEFGLVATTESKLYGPACNPWNLEHSTGGSSGGSGAAVAAGIVPLAHANDGGGSIRIPASANGLVGLKPSRGRVSHGPDFGESLDGIANDLVVSRTVRDTAAALDAVRGFVPGDPVAEPPGPESYLAAIKRKPKSLRIALSLKRLDGNPLHPDSVAATKHAAKLCEQMGHKVEEATPNLDLRMLMDAFVGAFWTGGLSAGIDQIAALTGQTPTRQLFEGMTWAMYQEGKKVTASQYVRAKAVNNIACREMARFHETYDVWLMPTLSRPPEKNGVFKLDSEDLAISFMPQLDYVPFTPVQNMTGQPAINVPLYWNKHDLPIGTQFVAPFGDEETLLRLAAQLEKAQPWFQRYATIMV